MIGFLDSGIGGINVVNACADVLSGQEVVYFCDDKNMPYGNKTQKQIKKIVFKNVKKLKKLGCRVIVFACNTATACAIKNARKKFDGITFVGTEPNVVEPKKLGLKKILVLCTPLTAKYSKILQVLDDSFVVFPCENLAQKIENNQDFSQYFSVLDCSSFDGVVLGCTHYYFAINSLKNIFVNAKFFSSLEGIRKKLQEVLNSPKIICSSKNMQKVEYVKNLLTNSKKL